MKSMQWSTKRLASGPTPMHCTECFYPTKSTTRAAIRHNTLRSKRASNSKGRSNHSSPLHHQLPRRPRFLPPRPSPIWTQKTREISLRPDLQDWESSPSVLELIQPDIGGERWYGLEL